MFMADRQPPEGLPVQPAAQAKASDPKRLRGRPSLRIISKSAGTAGQIETLIWQSRDCPLPLHLRDGVFPDAHHVPVPSADEHAACRSSAVFYINGRFSSGSGAVPAKSAKL